MLTAFLQSATFAHLRSYVLIGGTSTISFYVLFVVLAELMSPQLGYYIAFAICMTFSVLMNLAFTFKKKLAPAKILGSFATYLVTMNGGALLVDWLIDRAVEPSIAGLIVIPAIVVGNYLGLRLAAKFL